MRYSLKDTKSVSMQKFHDIWPPVALSVVQAVLILIAAIGHPPEWVGVFMGMIVGAQLMWMFFVVCWAFELEAKDGARQLLPGCAMTKKGFQQTSCAQTSIDA